MSVRLSFNQIAPKSPDHALEKENEKKEKFYKILARLLGGSSGSAIGTHLGALICPVPVSLLVCAPSCSFACKQVIDECWEKDYKILSGDREKLKKFLSEEFKTVILREFLSSWGIDLINETLECIVPEAISEYVENLGPTWEIEEGSRRHIVEEGMVFIADKVSKYFIAEKIKKIQQ